MKNMISIIALTAGGLAAATIIVNRFASVSSPADQIKRAALDAGCTLAMAQIIVAQSKHESGNYTSNVFKKGNNAFGMLMASKRPHSFQLPYSVSSQPNSEGAGKYAAYASPYNSCRDLIDWLKYNHFPLNYNSVVSYCTALKQKGYFTAPLVAYINQVQKFANT